MNDLNFVIEKVMALPAAVMFVAGAAVSIGNYQLGIPTKHACLLIGALTLLNGLLWWIGNNIDHPQRTSMGWLRRQAVAEFSCWLGLMVLCGLWTDRFPVLGTFAFAVVAIWLLFYRWKRCYGGLILLHVEEPPRV